MKWIQMSTYEKKQPHRSGDPRLAPSERRDVTGRFYKYDRFWIGWGTDEAANGENFSQVVALAAVRAYKLDVE